MAPLLEPWVPALCAVLGQDLSQASSQAWALVREALQVCPKRKDGRYLG